MEKVQALLDDEEKKIFTELNKKEGGFLREVLRHIKTFALKLYEMQQVIVTYYEDDDDSDWKAFFGDDPKTKIFYKLY
ncbi:14807_t:CDS:2 [Acaulospora morrowiae]|uniref:14807_t:CDS:1 n=1 Tax=Acaulospora morrowiae TaxID=94023 RepID=A0A9N9CDN3_9GLOM|nr:14807_t:CDS:2 [Acaulospora morrowiae]